MPFFNATYTAALEDATKRQIILKLLVMSGLKLNARKGTSQEKAVLNSVGDAGNASKKKKSKNDN